MNICSYISIIGLNYEENPTTHLQTILATA